MTGFGGCLYCEQGAVCLINGAPVCMKHFTVWLERLPPPGWSRRAQQEDQRRAAQEG